MKKRAWSHFLMRVMVFWLYGLLTIAASSSKSNGTTSLCDASVEDCLLESWLPTISSSHFRRVLADNHLQTPTQRAVTKPGKSVFSPSSTGHYTHPGPQAVKGQPMCGDPVYGRACHKGGEES